MLQQMKLTDAAGHQFYNTSPFDFAKLVADPQDLRANLSAYLAGFSSNVRDIFERFEFDKTLNKLAENAPRHPSASSAAASPVPS
jgi:type I restriction enzyme M protein